MAEKDLVLKPGPELVSATIAADITDPYLAYTFDADPEKAKLANTGDPFLGIPLCKAKTGRGAVAFSRSGTLIFRCSEAIAFGDRVVLDDDGLWKKDVAGSWVAITTTTATGQLFSAIKD